MLYHYETDNQNLTLSFDLFSPFEKDKWVFIANSFDYVQTFSSEIYSFPLLFITYNFKVFGEGSNANFILKTFKQFIHREGLPDGLLSKAATKVLVGYNGFHEPGIAKYKDFRFYYENQLNFDDIAEIMGVYSPSYYSIEINQYKLLESLTISEFTNAELTNEEAQDGWTYAPITEPSTYITKCNGLDVLGGYNNFNSNLTSISKTFTKSSPQAFTQILFNFYFIDTWDNETLTFSVDGTVIQQTTIHFENSASVRSNICGNSYGDNDFIGKFNYLLGHQSTAIGLSFSANLDEPENESWGIRDIYIITWDFCDESCGTCSGPSNSECTTCKKGLVQANINGVCQCDSSVHSELSGGLCICQLGIPKNSTIYFKVMEKVMINVSLAIQLAAMQEIIGMGAKYVTVTYSEKRLEICANAWQGMLKLMENVKMISLNVITPYII